jgi:ABC-type branched-subunit amino acid transport system substrate-binding protein
VRRSIVRVVAVVAAFVVVAAACGNAGDDDNTAKPSGASDTTVAATGGTTVDDNAPGHAPGVSATEIKVGGLGSATGPLAPQYGPIEKGVRAYLDMVNDAGGVNGRKITWVGFRDDATNPSQNVSQSRALVEQDKVFAIVGVAAPIFPGGEYLAQTGIPTFGWNVNDEWELGPNMFGEKGSFLDILHPGPALPFLAKKLGLTKVALLAYGVPQSADCAKGQASRFRDFGMDVVLEDTNLPFGATDISADIQKMKAGGVQFVTTCMDPSGNTLVSRSLKRAGMNDVVQYWPTGYDQETLQQFGAEMDGVWLGSFFVPFEKASTSKGMTKYLAEMKKRYPDVDPRQEVVLAGWIDADLFVTGLKAAGKNPTWEKVISSVNSITRYTANGIMRPIDWTKEHSGSGPYDCVAFVHVENGAFVPKFGTKDSPYTCFAPNSTTLNTVPAPKLQ